MPNCTHGVWESWASSELCYLKLLPPGQGLTDKRAGTVGCTVVGPPPPPPPPFFPFRNTSLPLAARVADLVERLSLEEKVAQMTKGGAAKNAPAPAIPALGIASHIWGTECATGLGSDDAHILGTSFPQPLGLAASWDTKLAQDIATATHVELRAQHNADEAKGVIAYHHGLNCWAPVVNIMRHWGWGRNDETFGECPVLSSAFAGSFVTGLQGDHPTYVAASAGCKHFGVGSGPDNLPTSRRVFDANVTLRDWATTFLPAFESCVARGSQGLMCSFNSIRGVPACASRRGMVTWAREQFGFEGYIVSDQGAAYGILSDHHYASDLSEAAALSISAGLDLEDANDADHVAFGGALDAVASGLLDEALVTASVARLFRVRMKLGEFDPAEGNPYRQIGTDQIRSPAHLRLSAAAAAKTLVLLRNEAAALPLFVAEGPASGGNAAIALVGPFADCPACLFGKYSPHMAVPLTTSLQAALNGSFANSSAKPQLRAAPGCSSPACTDYKGFDPAIFEGAAAVVIAAGLGSSFESEDRDRATMQLPGSQPALVADAIAAAHAQGVPAIVVLFSAGPVAVSDLDGADAILVAFYPAEHGGSAVADALLGRTSPAGRLPFSWPSNETDVPPAQDYTMVNRTYRYGQPNVAFRFGDGESYSTFAYSNTTVSTVEARVCESVTIAVSVTNTGRRASDEVVQGFLRWLPGGDAGGDAAGEEHPELSLFAFTRLADVQPGETRRVTLALTPRAMAQLTAPRCDVVPNSERTQLLGAPFANASASSAAACCSACAAKERCEGWTFDSAAPPPAACALHSAWALTTACASCVSGTPLAQWVARPGAVSLFVAVHGQPSAGEKGAVVSFSGAETPVAQC